MKGYKGMSKDMTCRGMKYEIGKSYHVDEPIVLCQSGLHFCQNLRDVFDYYPTKDNNRFFEISADGAIISDGKKNVTSDITVIRELTDIEVNRSVYGNGNGYGNVYGDVYGDGNGYGYITKIAIFKE